MESPDPDPPSIFSTWGRSYLTEIVGEITELDGVIGGGPLDDRLEQFLETECKVESLVFSMLDLEQEDADELFLREVLVGMQMVSHGYYGTAVEVVQVVVQTVLAQQVPVGLRIPHDVVDEFVG